MDGWVARLWMEHLDGQGLREGGERQLILNTPHHTPNRLLGWRSLGIDSSKSSPAGPGAGSAKVVEPVRREGFGSFFPPFSLTLTQRGGEGKRVRVPPDATYEVLSLLVVRWWVALVVVLLSYRPSAGEAFFRIDDGRFSWLTRVAEGGCGAWALYG